VVGQAPDQTAKLYLGLGITKLNRPLQFRSARESGTVSGRLDRPISRSGMCLFQTPRINADQGASKAMLRVLRRRLAATASSTRLGRSVAAMQDTYLDHIGGSGQSYDVSSSGRGFPRWRYKSFDLFAQ
jgi:hypothetical protein